MPDDYSLQVTMTPAQARVVIDALDLHNRDTARETAWLARRWLEQNRIG